MRALVFTGPGVVEVQDVVEPQAGPYETLIEVARAGICGSDLHGIRQVGFRKPPMILGHEFAGRTPDGKRAAVNPLIACGSCDQCAADRTQLCRNRALLGVHRAGAFAERVAVPDGAVHELPSTMSWEACKTSQPGFYAPALLTTGTASVRRSLRPAYPHGFQVAKSPDPLSR